jgi:UDP-GlcNAc:undecaprenyl-phosphate GlcNAc-1-phosphate transferase
MPLVGRLLLGLAFALVLVRALTPVAINIAGRLRFYDVPVGYKSHPRPTPYLGGAAVMSGFLVAMLALAGDPGRTAPLVAGVAVLWVVGTVDDRRTLRPAIRVGVELALAVGLWALGLGWDLGLGGVMDVVVTGLWIVAVVNAFNLFDNMDGAASAIALAVAAAVAVLGALGGDAWLAATGAALAGACLGFLPHNLASPARIFLGDGGSLPIGFAVGALAMIGASNAVVAWQALVIGLLLVGVPALDTALVMVSRRRRGVRIVSAGRDHLTHRARRRLRSARAVAVALGGAQALLAALALFASQRGSGAVIVAVVVYLSMAGTAIAVLETHEDRLVAGSEIAPGGARPSPARRWPPARALPLAVLALGAALSPLAFGYYDSKLWVPIGLGLVVATAAGVAARPPALTLAGVLALAGLLGLAAWALLSSSWAASAEQAMVEGDRMLVLASVLGAGLVLARTRRDAATLVALLGCGVLGVAGVVVVRMLGGNAASLFLGGRLNEPLGYINAEATVFVIGAWLCLAAAERRHPVLAGAGLAGATLCASLALLSQSRGAALAAIVSAVVVLALVPGRRRRVLALAALGLALAGAGGALLDVYDSAAGGPVSLTAAHRAAGAALLAALTAGLAWGAATACHGLLTARRPDLAAPARRLADAAIAIGATAAAVLAIASAGQVARTVHRQYDAFVHVGEPGGSVVADAQGRTRLLSGGGNRYDYWRVAWHAFADHPLRGLGAGGYDRAWFSERRVAEDVRQPHSLEMQALAETGLVGAALLLALVGGLALGAWRASRVAARTAADHAVAIAGIGGVCAWLVHTSVDWMHLLPGVTAIALCLAATLVRIPRLSARERRRAPAPARLRRVRVAGALGVAAIVALAGASLGRQGVAEHLRRQAVGALPQRPADALRDANRSLRLDGAAVPTYYVKAAALARFDRADEAQRALLEAAAREPDRFVTYALLGDLAVRRGDLRAAQHWYARAHALNPLDPALARLARDPGSASG